MLSITGNTHNLLPEVNFWVKTLLLMILWWNIHPHFLYVLFSSTYHSLLPAPKITHKYNVLLHHIHHSSVLASHIIRLEFPSPNPQHSRNDNFWGKHIKRTVMFSEYTVVPCINKAWNETRCLFENMVALTFLYRLLPLQSHWQNDTMHQTGVEC